MGEAFARQWRSQDDQGVLIRQLQEQHYHQYMQQVLNQQQQQQQQTGMADGGDAADGRPPADPQAVITNGGDGDTKAEEEDSSADEESTEEGGQGVGHGEVVTVRVPTHPNGNCLFWEFATDSYDLGFGIYFEWTAEPGNQMSVHVSESEEEDEEEEVIDESGDSGVPPGLSREVYAGSHLYPGQGVYLLKFDNSYSLWRSKTLYYRVYYTR
ncbi:hypothetical protein HPB51_002015 [Rhipicephalus microplus]|uniref:GOLD domain-containing protein n=1 Tax=Rhipicephalus microplus TaxID=6941 RepID=A0A9J6DYB4_RHIMP|nr:hypothetical protein HPB51_002015 [Rhipicephalus microplus]